MITTVTFNPAVDKTAQVETLVTGGLNRLQNVRQDAGGKGINVSKTLKAIGVPSRATGFLAGNGIPGRQRRAVHPGEADGSGNRP